MLTKAQIEKLPIEQQEVLAQIELSRTCRRQKLLDLARGRDWRGRYFPLWIFALFMIFVGFYYMNLFHIQEKPSLLIFFVVMMFVNGLIFHIARTNQRLDALLELLDFDHKNQDDSDISKDEKVV